MKEFKDQAVLRMRESLSRIVQCLGMLTEEQVWAQPNENTNSVGNLTLHLCGNIRQYIYAGLGENPDDRQRNLEFDPDNQIPSSQLETKITETINEAIKIITNLDEANFHKKYRVQVFDLTGLGIVLHVVEHLSYHTGQIALLCKLQINEDLGFYKDLKLD